MYHRLLFDRGNTNTAKKYIKIQVRKEEASLQYPSTKLLFLMFILKNEKQIFI